MMLNPWQTLLRRASRELQNSFGLFVAEPLQIQVGYSDRILQPTRGLACCTAPASFVAPSVFPRK
jgi:hypothetical protein